MVSPLWSPETPNSYDYDEDQDEKKNFGCAHGVVKP